MERNWRPKGWDSGPCNKSFEKGYEAGASAIIPHVRAQVLKKVGELLTLKAIPHSKDFLVPRQIIEAFLRGEMPEEAPTEVDQGRGD